MFRTTKITAVVLACLLGGAALAAVEQLRSRSGSFQSVSGSAAVYVPGRLEKAARLKGSYRETRSPHAEANADLPYLVKHSQGIIVGRIRSSHSWLVDTGDSITTDYEVLIEQSLKGPWRPADTLTMSVVGGRVGFADGSWAQVDTPGMVPPLRGERYVLFLRPTHYDTTPEQRAAARGPIYMAAFMSLGMFRVSDTGIVTPNAWRDHPLRKEYAGKRDTRLLGDIAELLERGGGRRGGPE